MARLFLIFLSFLFVQQQADARVYKVEEVPMVHLQDRTRYVSNPDNILSPSAVSAMDNMLFTLEQQTGIQVAVVVLTGIDGGDCFDFAYRLGQRHGIGQEGRDNGLVILLSTDERCVQFVTGYGLEGVLPDALCKRIQQRYMVEHFSSNDWDTGMVEGLRAVCGTLDGSMENVDEDDGGLVLLGIFGVIFLIAIVAVSVAVWRNSRCPQCGKHDIQRIDSCIVEGGNGYKVREDKYYCKKCGHIFTRRVRLIDNNNHRSGGGGVVIGGGFGRGIGGGGFGGGSFGGGSFGGGGAGSRF